MYVMQAKYMIEKLSAAARGPLIGIMICVTCIFIVCCIRGRRNVSWRERENALPLEII